MRYYHCCGDIQFLSNDMMRQNRRKCAWKECQWKHAKDIKWSYNGRTPRRKKILCKNTTNVGRRKKSCNSSSKSGT